MRRGERPPSRGGHPGTVRREHAWALGRAETGALGEKAVRHGCLAFRERPVSTFLGEPHRRGSGLPRSRTETAWSLGSHLPCHYRGWAATVVAATRRGKVRELVHPTLDPSCMGRFATVGRVGTIPRPTPSGRVEITRPVECKGRSTQEPCHRTKSAYYEW